MDFKVDMRKLSVQVLERKSHIVNEEMTKQALIIPFLQKLGYDVFNPLEVKPEYVSDFGIKKGEKVDYAIFKNGVPIIFVEAKSVNEKLDKHNSQLYRYFNATPDVKIAMITNGVNYHFYTDLNQDNIMDNEPFFSFSMESLTNTDIETIETFSKDHFDADRLVKFAEELVYMSNLNTTLKDLFRNPTDEFLRFLIKDFSSSRITSNVLDRFRPIVKKAINHTLLEIISEGLSTKETISEAAVSIAEPVANPTKNILEEDTEEASSAKKGIITTEDELKCFEIVKDILDQSKLNINDLKYKDTINYFSIFNKVTTKWFLRVNLNASEAHILTRLPVDHVVKLCPETFKVETAPKGYGESRIIIQSISDLKELSNLIITCYKEVHDF